ncbi:predicted protein [Postia placenta Mad-698-R]|nr:predicted protein [Postia placenta Mad-698-R]
MLWLQIATKLGIALLTFVTHPQTYGNPYLPLTIGAFIEAAVPNILFIAENAAHSFITSIPSLPAPPTRQAISGSPATAPSTDLILWTPIGLPVSAGLHLPTLMATPISSPSGATEERNHALAQQLEYPTKDLIVWEARTGGPVDAFGSTNFVASAIVAIVIACYVYIVAKVLCACVLYTFAAVASSADVGTPPPFDVELALNCEGVSADFSNQALVSGIATESDAHVHHNDTLDTAETLPVASDDISPAQTTDATVTHLDDNRAVDTQDIRGADHAQANTDLETTAPSTPTMIDGQDPSAPDVSARPLVALLPQQANRIDVLYPASTYLDRWSNSSTSLLPSAFRHVLPSRHVALSLGTRLPSPAQKKCKEHERQCEAISASIPRWKIGNVKPSLESAAKALVLQRELRKKCETQFDELTKRCAEVDECCAQLDSEVTRLEQDDEQLECERVAVAEARSSLAEEYAQLDYAHVQLAAEQSRLRVGFGLSEEEHEHTEEYQTECLKNEGAQQPEDDPMESIDEFYRLLNNGESQAEQEERLEQSTTSRSTERTG